MAKTKSRPQTNEPGEVQSEAHPDSNLLELWWFGSESYSGTRNWCRKACGFESHRAHDYNKHDWGENEECGGVSEI